MLNTNDVLRMLHDPSAPAVNQIYRSILLPNGVPVSIKLEGLRANGAIKDKPARAMIVEAIKRGLVDPATGIAETSSGNTGRALASVCAELKIRCRIIVDPNASETNLAMIQSLGAEVIMVDTRDANGGFQLSRLEKIAEMKALEPGLFVPNQYDNPANAQAHRRQTAPEILTAHPDVKLIFAPVGTGGTATGTALGLQDNGSKAVVVGCDVEGSVTFGGPPGTRYISGPGNSFVPGNWDPSVVTQAIYVPEIEAVAMCRWLSRTYGLLVGGSTGMALAGVRRALPKNASTLLTEGDIVVISPDMGDKYLAQIWNDGWVEACYGLELLKQTDRSLGLC